MTHKTIRMAGIHMRDGRLRVFHAYGPSPMAFVYSDEIRQFPDTKLGLQQAREFIEAYGVQRGEYDVEDEFEY